MKKYILDLKVVENRRIHELYTLLVLSTSDGSVLPEMLPGQFVQVAVDGSKNTFLRRPISINNVDRENNNLWLLVRNAGEGTRTLMALKTDDNLNVVLPLGNSFSMPASVEDNVLLKELLFRNGTCNIKRNVQKGIRGRLRYRRFQRKQYGDHPGYHRSSF